MSKDKNNEEVSEDDIDEIDALLGQLQVPKDKVTKEVMNLPKEELAQFILNHAGQLVKDSLDSVQEAKNVVDAGGHASDVEALAKLISSASSTVETLNKIVIQDMRAQSAKEIKQMDVDSKKQLQDEDIRAKLVMNREDLLESYIKKAEAIDIDSEELNTTEDDIKELDS